MRLLSIAVATAILVAAPLAANAEPPADADDYGWSEETHVLDPVKCTITTYWLSWWRDELTDPWQLAERELVDVSLAVEEDCPDWHQDEEGGDWYYMPPVVLDGDAAVPMPGAPVAIIGEREGQKVGLLPQR